MQMPAAKQRSTEEIPSAAGAFERVGCSLLTFSGAGLDEALDRVQAHGFKKVDLAVVPGHCDHVDLLALAEGGVEELSASLRRRGLEVSSINLHPGDMAAPEFGAAERRIRAAIDVARRLGAPVLTLPAGQRVPPEQWDAAARVVAKRVRSFLDLAERAGVTLSLEAPHFHTIAEDAAEAGRLFELVGDPRLTCTFDTSHVQRGNRLPLVEGLRTIGVPVSHVHLRDTLRGEITHTPGKGDCDFGPFLAALLREGYRGDFNFELEYEGAARDEIERELGFAREHIRMLLAGEALPFAHRLYRQGWFRAVDQAAWIARHPREFVVAHPSLKAVLRPPVRAARHMRREWIPYRDFTYRAGWQRRWRVGRLPSTISARPAASAARAAGPEKRVAILGCGYTGRFEHGPGFARLPGMNVVGVCDVRPERATLLGSKLGCPSFTDAAELLRGVKPDLVINCTREWQHVDTTLASFEAGADVFCEKILAESLASGEAMVRAARERGRVLGVNYNWRFLPGIRRIRELRESGELGKLRMLRLFAHACVSHHAIDLARFLAGPIRTVSATFLDDPGLRGLPEWNPYTREMLYFPTAYSLVTFQAGDDVGVSLSTSEVMDARAMLLTVDAIFQEGTVTLSGIVDDDALGSLTAATTRKIDLRLDRGDAPAGFALSFQRSIEAFVESYRRGAALPTSGEDALEVMRIEHAIVRSHETGTRILL